MTDYNDTSNWHEYRTLFGHPLKVTLTMDTERNDLDITDAITLKDAQLHIDNDRVLTAIKEHRLSRAEQQGATQ